MSAAAIRSETLARRPSGPALRSVRPLDAPDGTHGRAPRSVAGRVVRLIVLTALLVGLIGQGASALRHHLAPPRSKVVVLLNGAPAASTRP